MNYEEELNNAKTPTTKFWKPGQGTHKVVLTAEAEELPEKRWDEKDKDGKPRVKVTRPVLFRAEFDGVGQEWIVNKGKRPTSLFVQLMKVIVKHGGHATGTAFTLLVQGEGVERRYTIPEAI